MTYRKNPPEITLRQLKWQETGTDEDPSGRLLAHIRIAGVDMHLEAYAIDPKADEQESVCWPETLLQVGAGLGMEGHWCTLEFRGRTYVLIAQPYGD